MHGFQLNYTDWIFHGESSSTHHNVNETYRVDEMTELVHDAFGLQSQNEHDNNDQEKHQEGIDDNASKFFKLLMEANCELFEGCKKYSLLSFIVRLFHMKVLYKWSNISCSLLLQLLKDAFPVNDKFPDSYQKLRKIVSELVAWPLINVCYFSFSFSNCIYLIGMLRVHVTYHFSLCSL